MKRIHNLKGLALAVLMSVGASASVATTISVSQGMMLGQVYGSNSANLSYASSFDAASALGTSQFGTDFTVNSAMLHFSWVDNPDDPYTASSTTGWNRSYGPYNYSYLSGYTAYYSRSVTGSKTDRYATPSESAVVTLGSSAIASPSTLVASSVTSSSTSAYAHVDSSNPGYWVSSGYNHSYRCGFLHLRTCHEWIDTSHAVYGSQYTSNYQDTTLRVLNDYTGSFVLDIDLLALGGDALGDLMDDGILGLGLSMAGSAILNDATLVLDVTQNSISATVPEPGVLWLLVLALGGLSWLHRDRLRLARFASSKPTDQDKKGC